MFLAHALFLRPTPSAIPGAGVNPFSLVDRGAVLASRLDTLPAEVVAGGGVGYLGWFVLLLCLVAVWPVGRQAPTRRAGLVLTLAFLLVWATFGAQNPHARLRELIEYATVRRYVEPATLNLLGALTVLLALLVLLAFLATAALLSGKCRWTCPVVLVSSAMALGWWTAAPGNLGETAGRISVAVCGSMPVRSAVALLLACVAALGLQRCSRAPRRRHRRLVLSVVLLALTLLDLSGRPMSGRGVKGALLDSSKPMTLASTRV